MTNTTPDVEEMIKRWYQNLPEETRYSGNYYKVHRLELVDFITTLTAKHEADIEKAVRIERHNIGSWIEQQDFARKEGERSGDPASVWAVQTVIKQINQFLQTPTKTDKTTEV